MTSDLIKLIRPQQWIKNAFVFVPMFFGGSLFNGTNILSAFVAFVAFSMVASSIYCFNDIIDVDDDRRHPTKCHRPIASGRVSAGRAYALMAALPCLAAALLCLLPVNAMGTAGVMAFYYVLNLAYCLKLKQYAIVDVCIIAFGFVLRLYAGGLSTGTPLSSWIVLMTFLLTLFLSLAKRRDDVLKMMETGRAPRKNTTSYNLTFINQAITITSSVTLVCYIMYTVSPDVTANIHSEYLYLTSVLVLLGLLRYLQIAVVDEKSGNPTKVMLHDRFIQVVVLLWALAFALLIYVV